MTTTHNAALAAILLTFASAAAAQPPPRPGDPQRSVTLSLADYNRLIDLANQAQPGPAPAPVAAVLASADLRVRVDRDTARGTFNVTGETFRSGFSRVGLLSGATLVDATADGSPLPLIADGAAHTALIPGPGAFSLTLEWGGPLTFAPGRASFTLPVPPSGTARATFDLPGEQADVRLSAGLIVRSAVAGGRTIVEAALDPGSSTEVSWSMRDSLPAAATRELRTLADVLTLVTIGDSDVRMAALIDVTVVQGELRTLTLRLPAGYELTGISGSSLENSQPREDGVVLTVGDPAARNHQFLVGLERAHPGGSFALETGFVSVRDVQRERGEVAVEGIGTIELTATERDGMHRIDVRELSSSLHSLTRLPILSAFRYQRTAAAVPGLALDVKRFADAGVLAAVADRATATTLVTSEGRALTEIVLQLQNRAQPFLKVTLPPGASVVSVVVAGAAAKPVGGVDGTRVPLLRPGFRPVGAYHVSFVYLHAGAPFARKGDMEMTLPKMDIPIGIVEWEVFVPDTYSARAVGGNAISARTAGYVLRAHAGSAGGRVAGGVKIGATSSWVRGQIHGRVTDPTGAVMPGALVTVTADGFERTVTTSKDGMFAVLGVPSGRVTTVASLNGFVSQGTTLDYTQAPLYLEFELGLASIMETITVHADAPSVDRVPEAPSQNVIALQRRASGVLPIRVDVPRAGRSHQFVKPLVVDQETTLTLRYKRR